MRTTVNKTIEKTPEVYPYLAENRYSGNIALFSAEDTAVYVHTVNLTQTVGAPVLSGLDGFDRLPAGSTVTITN